MGKKKGQKKATKIDASAVTKEKETTSHQETLDRMKEKDSEFYEFLAKEDPSMLTFDATADDDLLTSDEEGDEHQIPDHLEVASDDEDFDDDDDDNEEDEVTKVAKKQQVVVDQKMIAHWQGLVTTDASSLNVLKEILQAYHGCLARIDADAEDEGKKKKRKNHAARLSGPSHKYKVTTDTVFNSMISLCMQSVPQALDKILQYNTKEGELSKKRKLKLPSSCKRWSNIRDTLRVYLDDVLTLTLALVEPSVTRVFVRHMIIMLPYYLSLPKVCKKLARLLVKLWSSSDTDSIRVLSFACLHRLVKLDKKRMHENVLKQCYLSYVANCKFTSPTLLPMINFMQQTFAELCQVDSPTTYRFAFLYIRQLAVHLRKAIVENNKETRKAVYNWQYVHCVALWCRVLSKLHPNPTLQPLIYPLIQVALGVIDLVATPRFYPLRYHILDNLIGLGACTNVYIPLVPFIIAPLLLHDFKKKQIGTSLKPLSFDCILKLSNSQIKEKAYRDSTMDHIYDSLMSFFNSHAHTIAFPEMAVPAVVLLKKFAKDCRAPQYSKMMRRIVEKVEENSNYITTQRTNVTFAVTDDEQVDVWETDTQSNGVPFNKHFTQYRKNRERELAQQIADKDRNVDEKLPTINRNQFLSAQNKAADRVEFDQLFDQNEEEDFQLDFENAVNKSGPPRAKKAKRKKEAVQSDDDDDDDDMSDDDVADDDSEVSMDSDIPLTSDEDEEEEEAPKVVKEKKKVSTKKQVEATTKKVSTKKQVEATTKKVSTKKQAETTTKKVSTNGEPVTKKVKKSQVDQQDVDDVVGDFDISQF